MENELIEKKEVSNESEKITAHELVEGTAEKVSKNRITKIKNSFKDFISYKHNLIFIIIFVFIILLRLYYFMLTKNQPLWYDEAEYMSMAKTFAGIVNFQFNEQRLPGLPLLVALFYLIGISNEVFIKFIVIFIPSIIVIFIFYFLILEMYSDKRIALLSTAILGVLWEHLFYSNRFHTENLALLFQFLAIFVLYKVYMKKEDLWIIKPKYSIIWILLFCFISVLFRPGNIPYIPVVFLFMILLNFKKLSNKYSRKTIIASLVGLFIIGLFSIPILSKIPLLRTYYHPTLPIAWLMLGSIKGFYGTVIPNLPSVLYYLFLLGFVIALVKVTLIIDHIFLLKRDNKSLEFKSNIFNLLLILVTFLIFIFIIRGAYEIRYFFIFLPAMLSFTAFGILFISDNFSKYFKMKHLSIIIILVLLLPGLYNQYVHADKIIRIKVDTYAPIKESGIWMKENSLPTDKILSRSPTQTTYYSERETFTFAFLDEYEFLDLVREVRPKYMMESVLEPNPPAWGFAPPPENVSKILLPVNAWFSDAEKTQPILIIYEINYAELDN